MIKSPRFTEYLFTGLLVVGMAVMATGCGSAPTMSNLLSGIQLKSFTQNGDLWAELDAQLNTGGFILAGLSVPIVNPNNPSIIYGQLSLQENLCSGSNCTGQGKLTIAIDITQVAHVPIASSDNLPNGTPIPVSGLGNAALIVLPVGGMHAQIYIALGQGVAMMGAALPFKALDNVGKYVPGVDIFDAFNIGKATGLVGLFFGSTADTSGLGLFADLSNVINASSSAPVAAHMAVETQQMVEAIRAEPNRLIMRPVDASWDDRSTVDYQLYRLSRRHAQLILQ